MKNLVIEKQWETKKPVAIHNDHASNHLEKKTYHSDYSMYDFFFFYLIYFLIRFLFYSYQKIY